MRSCPAKSSLRKSLIKRASNLNWADKKSLASSMIFHFTSSVSLSVFQYCPLSPVTKTLPKTAKFQLTRSKAKSTIAPMVLLKRQPSPCGI